MDYSATILSAYCSLVAKGLLMTLRKVTHGTIDNDTGVVGVTNTNTPVYGIIKTAKKTREGNTLVKEGVKEVLISAYDVSVGPVSGDLLIAGSDTYRIVTAEALAPGNVAITYTLQVRK